MRALIGLLVFCQHLRCCQADGCPASHPYACSSESDVNENFCRDNWRSDDLERCKPKYFNGPCCDESEDCLCIPTKKDLHALPHTPVPTSSRAPSCSVSPGTVGDYVVGINWGGSHVCTSDGTANGPLLTGTELAEACLAVCLADPRCRSFEIGSPKLADADRQEGGWYAVNCAIEHHSKTDPAVRSIRSTSPLAGAYMAQVKNCWTGYEIEGTCTTQPEWAPSKAKLCWDPSEALGGGVYGRGSIGHQMDPSSAFMEPNETVYRTMLALCCPDYLARLDAIDDDTCDGWTVEGAPAIHAPGFHVPSGIQVPSSERSKALQGAMYVLTGILGLFGLTLIVLLVVSRFTEKAKPQATRTGTPNVDEAAGWGPFGFLFPKSWVYVWWGFLAMVLFSAVILPKISEALTPNVSTGVWAQSETIETILSVGPFIHCILMPFLWTHKHREAKKRIENQGNADVVEASELDPEAKTVIFSMKLGCGQNCTVLLAGLTMGLVEFGL